jgi:hypothetical protein
VHKSGNTSKILLTVALCVAASLPGCSRKETATLSERENLSTTPGAKSAEVPAELPLERQTEQKLEPLTKEDVDLYLKVMRAAAERVKNLQPGDRAALDNARRILAGSDSGRIPTPEEVKTLERANLVALYMDQIVAEEMRIDGRTYRGIAAAVESAVPNPVPPLGAAADSVPAPVHAPTPLEVRLNSVNAANQKFLTPYSEEIQSLIAIVHNPGNLPK